MAFFFFLSREESRKLFAFQLLSNCIFRMLSLNTVNILAQMGETSLNIMKCIYSPVIPSKYILQYFKNCFLGVS